MISDLPLIHEQKSLLISIAFVGLASTTTSSTQILAEPLTIVKRELLLLATNSVLTSDNSSAVAR